MLSTTNRYLVLVLFYRRNQSAARRYARVGRTGAPQFRKCYLVWRGLPIAQGTDEAVPRSHSRHPSLDLGENFFANAFADESLRSLCEGHLIGEAAFKKHPYRRMVKRICSRDQGHVLPDTQVHEANGFA